MNKLLNTSVDILLFSLLVIIFIIPFIVSVNLDPKLYQKSQNVAGISTTNESSENYLVFTENYSLNDRLFFRNSKYKYDVYTAQFKLSKGEKFEDDYKLGVIENHSIKNSSLYINTYGDKSELADIEISVLFEYKEYILFDGLEFTPQEIALPPNAVNDLLIKIKTRYNTNFDCDIILEIKPIIIE